MTAERVRSLIIGMVPQWYAADGGPYGIDLGGRTRAFYSQRPLTPELSKLCTWMNEQFERGVGELPEIPMPSAYDDFSERAHPAWTGGTEAERASRDRLRAFMEAEGFTVYENEWWHFDYKGWREYPVLDVSFDSVRTAKR